MGPHYTLNQTDMILVGENFLYVESNYITNEKINIAGYITTTVLPRICKLAHIFLIIFYCTK